MIYLMSLTAPTAAAFLEIETELIAPILVSKRRLVPRVGGFVSRMLLPFED